MAAFTAVAGAAAGLRWSWATVEAGLRVVNVVAQGSEAVVRTVVEQSLETVELAGLLSRVALALAVLAGAGYACSLLLGARGAVLFGVRRKYNPTDGANTNSPFAHAAREEAPARRFTNEKGAYRVTAKERARAIFAKELNPPVHRLKLSLQVPKPSSSRVRRP